MGEPCKHGHVDGVRHRRCPECRIEELEARLVVREEYISRRERQHDETANTVISLAFDKGKLEKEIDRLHRRIEELEAALNEFRQPCPLHPYIFVTADNVSCPECEIKRLREALQCAPHDSLCATVVGDVCDCWKSKALEEKS